MDAGHFQRRDKMSTRWNERNAHAQCPHENRFKSGEQFKHGQRIDEIHGEGTAAFLLGVSNRPHKYSLEDITKIAEYWRAQAKQLAQEKGIAL